MIWKNGVVYWALGVSASRSDRNRALSPNLFVVRQLRCTHRAFLTPRSWVKSLRPFYQLILIIGMTQKSRGAAPEMRRHHHFSSFLSLLLERLATCTAPFSSPIALRNWT